MTRDNGAAFEWFTLMDSTGQVMRSDPNIRRLGDFSKKGVAICQFEFADGKTRLALVNQQLEEVGKQYYEYLSDTEPGYIAKQNGHYGMIDVKGRTLIPFEYPSEQEVLKILRSDIHHYINLSKH